MSADSGNPTSLDCSSDVPEQVKVALPWIEAHCRFVPS